MSAAGYSSRKFVTEELLVKLNTVLEQLARQQPPINPSVDAYKHENDKVEFYLVALKKNPDDPYLRAQLHQAMEDKQHLYNLIQGNKNPFKTETSTSEGTQTQTTKSATTQSDVLSEMERIREMFKTPEKLEQRQRHQSGPGSLYYTEKPEDRQRHHSGPGSFHYVEKPSKRSSGYYSHTTSRPKGFPPKTPVRPSQFGQKPRRLVTDAKDWS